MKRAVLSIVFFVMLIFLACERQAKEFAGAKGALPGSPAFSVDPQLAVVPALSHVASVAPKIAEEKVIDGAALFAANCSPCHQATGKGLPGAFPPLDQSPYVVGEEIDVLAAIMIYGLIGPIEVLGTKYQSAMAGLGQTLSDQELAAVATYIRSSWSNKASPVKADTFTAARKKWGSRGPLTIAELGG